MISQEHLSKFVKNKGHLHSALVANGFFLPSKRTAFCTLKLMMEIFNDQGEPVREQKGELVCTAPFPSMPVSFWNDTGGAKYRAAYFERFPNVWCHGDYAELTEHDGVIIYGRSDTVLNPGGVRIGTSEPLKKIDSWLSEVNVLGC